MGHPRSKPLSQCMPRIASRLWVNSAPSSFFLASEFGPLLSLLLSIIRWLLIQLDVVVDVVVVVVVVIDVVVVSVSIGVNALVGLFLTFAGGFWAAEYAGVQTLSTRLLVGLVMSFVCLLVEVFLLILHDERQRGRRAAASTPPATVPRSFSIPEECAAPSSPAPAPEPFAAPAARGELQPAKETGVELQLAKKTEVELQLRKRSKVQAATIELTAIKEPPAFVGDKANEPTGPKSASRDDAMGGQSHIASSIGKRISEGGVAPSSLSDRHDTMRQRK
eukprot:GHVT01033352.1.p1 GENE.GHVT01033352.1~~GHVT01033352.1.p1  ORF type:complete len:278 (+),score=48.81 GHVT01033352.1:79-912(+)